MRRRVIPAIHGDRDKHLLQLDVFVDAKIIGAGQDHVPQPQWAIPQPPGLSSSSHPPSSGPTSGDLSVSALLLLHYN